MIVLNEERLHRHLRSFIGYYHRTRTHLVLQKDTPGRRHVQPLQAGRIISIPEVGGLITGTSAELPEQERRSQAELPSSFP